MDTQILKSGILSRAFIFPSQNANFAVYPTYTTTRHVKSHIGTTACKRVYFCSVFTQRLCQESVSISNMSFPLSSFPVLYWSWQSHIKAKEKHRSTKKSSIPFLHQKASLGPGRFHSQARLVLLGDGLNLSGTEAAQNIRLPLAVNFLALSLPAIHLIICLFLFVSQSF